MTTSVRARDNSSRVPRWVRVSDEPGTAVSRSLYWPTTQEPEAIQAIKHWAAYMTAMADLVSEGFRSTTAIHAPIDVAALADVSARAEARAAFDQLASEWQRETAHLSSPAAIAEHNAYQEIIGMGEDAIPWILRDLEATHSQWFWALRCIARESPVKPEDRGDIEAMTTAWLDWGKRHRYIKD